MINTSQSITCELITGLSTKKARLTFEQLGQNYYETDLFRMKFSRDVNMTSRAIQAWRTNICPPAWAILLLDAWLTIKDLKASQNQIGKAYELIKKFHQDRNA